MAPAVFPKTPEHVITDILSLLKQPVDTLPALGDNFFSKIFALFCLNSYFCTVNRYECGRRSHILIYNKV